MQLKSQSWMCVGGGHRGVYKNAFARQLHSFFKASKTSGTRPVVINVNIL